MFTIFSLASCSPEQEAKTLFFVFNQSSKDALVSDIQGIELAKNTPLLGIGVPLRAGQHVSTITKGLLSVKNQVSMKLSQDGKSDQKFNIPQDQLTMFQESTDRLVYLIICNQGVFFGVSAQDGINTSPVDFSQKFKSQCFK